MRLLLSLVILLYSGFAWSIDPREIAMQGLEQSGIDAKKLVVVDYSLPSTANRLFVYDLEKDQQLMNTRVAHGKNTGNNRAVSFSNQPNSYKSSLGFFRIAEKYRGKHGLSIRLDGLEPGINDNARKRAIVIHGAWYVSDEMIQKYGRLGRSYGCPALSKKDFEKFVSIVDSETILFIYHPNEEYFSKTSFLENRDRDLP